MSCIYLRPKVKMLFNLKNNLFTCFIDSRSFTSSHKHGMSSALLISYSTIFMQQGLVKNQSPALLFFCDDRIMIVRKQERLKKIKAIRRASIAL